MNNKSKKQPNLDREDAWMSIAETTVLAIAFWLEPTGIAPFLLKLCFQILKTLRHHHRQ
jgi:hypothetical protein